MAQPQQNSTDQTANFFWLLVIICLAMFAVWFFKRQWFIIPIFWMRIAEVKLILWSAFGWDYLARWLPLPTIDVATLNRIQTYIFTVNPLNVDWDDFATINKTIGEIIRFPFMLILGILGLISLFRHASMRFRNVYTMDKLKHSEHENWPQITPVLEIDLVKEDPEIGPWSMAKTPLMFCKEHNIARLEADPHIEDRRIWIIDEGIANRAFTMQLGQLWQGVDALPIHTKALLVVFLCRAHKDRKTASNLLAQIASSASHGKLNFAGVTELAEKYKSSKYLKWVEKRHAYIYTVMACLLEMARSDGVVATAEFLWLKPVDRRLWYMLNSVGRQTAVVEVAGPFAHWLAEKKLQRKLKTPMTREAVTALETEVTKILFIPDEERWHTTNAG